MAGAGGPGTEDGLEALRRGDLAGARRLRLSGLDTFPREIFGLAETLEVLDLSGGTLDRLPDDLGRLTKLRVLFCSNNRFARLPSSLGDCQALAQVGFRAAGLREVPGEALPPHLRWLTLTDNALVSLPDALGQRPALQKLMLAGNRLTRLPDTLAGAGRLELLRIAANAFETLPPWLVALPRLAWLAYAGNPVEAAPPRRPGLAVPWAALTIGPLLGEGASGRIHAAYWHGGHRDVAVKFYKGPITSDGLPEHEMAACLAAGDHPALVGALGRIENHPEGLDGLVMPRLAPGLQPLAGPPSLESCTRDVYAPDTRPTPVQVLRIAAGVAAAASHLHARGLLHGDLYAHNILWDPAAGAALLSDFGAASRLAPGAAGVALTRLDVRAYGILLAELHEYCGAPDSLPPAFGEIARACLSEAVGERPAMAEVSALLAALEPV
ncbi:leucine-rich repeat-containing protein kinase family protein [Lichenihabitans sp. Uapishka_5]|uniref:leucine-rich repeat-containing protein kinase family protein n=1 Tax=Lichenihabitans sp. Uapishka_5 TaxID=3037302 RepID=UPI0029E81EA1|nr:leucine-rich repeat-containing protein kinase family protein [Lichenihabitans sp. Uapishka_5]MDX7953751.1 leucine-rich repeat-containing protein kinase family protein [Lichenihabitans sp. Uapishka_5]